MTVSLISALKMTLAKNTAKAVITRLMATIAMDILATLAPTASQITAWKVCALTMSKDAKMTQKAGTVITTHAVQTMIATHTSATKITLCASPIPTPAQTISQDGSVMELLALTATIAIHFIATVAYARSTVSTVTTSKRVGIVMGTIVSLTLTATHSTALMIFAGLIQRIATTQWRVSFATESHASKTQTASLLSAPLTASAKSSLSSAMTRLRAGTVLALTATTISIASQHSARMESVSVKKRIRKTMWME